MKKLRFIDFYSLVPSKKLYGDFGHFHDVK